LWLAPDPDGRLWVGTPGGAGVVGADRRFSRSLPWRGEGPYGRIYSVLLRDSSGQYWLESFGGLAMGHDGRAEVVGTYSELRQGRIKPAWSAAHEDREGGLWLGSADAGLWYLAPSWRQFSILLHDPDDPRTPANVDVTAIAPAADGGMWTVGNSGALDWLDPGSGHFRHVYSDTGDYVPEVVLEDDAGSVWIGFHAGLARFDRAGGAMHMWQADHPTDPAPDGRVVALVQAAEGLVWAVTAYDGVQARDREGRVRERVEPGDGRGLEAGRYVTHAGRGPDGALWLAGEPGLLMWNSGTRALEPVPGAPADEVGTFVVEGHRRVWTARPGALESFTW